MLSSHEREFIEEITNFNTLTLISVSYTVYEQILGKKGISKKEFYKHFEENFIDFKDIIYREDV